MNEHNKKGMNFKKRFILALPQAPMLLSNVLIHNAFIKYYTDMIGLSASLVGLIYLIFSIWNAINDPLLGLYIDRFRYRPGKGKLTYLMKVTYPLMVFSSMAMLFSRPSWPEWIIFALFLFLLFIFDTALTTYGTSYASYLLLAAPTNKERVDVSVLQGYLAFAASFLGTLIPTLLLVGDGDKKLVIPLFSAVIIINTAMFWMASRHLEDKREMYKGNEAEESGNFFVQARQHILDVFKSRAFLTYVIYAIMTKGVITFYFTPFLYYMDHVLKVSGTLATVADIATGAAVFLFYPFVGWVIKKAGVKSSLWLIVIPAAIGYAGLYFTANFVMATVFFSLICISNAGLMALEVPVMGAIIDEDTFRSDERKAGIFMGMKQLLFIPAIGLQTMIFTMVIDWFGYDGTAAVQSAMALQGLRIATGLIPLVFILLGLIPVLFFPINRLKERELTDLASETEL